ncbi:DNA polymerase III subunit delta [Solibacillus sp. R5-41]|uniref:DNA polymerase III subunit delta n=1 Tax=Solibacillus sp. R5-41 TaxID=2048654 RepID=UPI000C1249A5|nr:DNA polymerase III subunit delta [Solibacillus sp. R5-41]ATP41793.1 DNA polymerase III subunit delta [Solibacillus sp. R5-41]
MFTIQLCVCENCGRSDQSVTVENHTIHQHVAQLCPTCIHILSLPTNEVRFLQLARKKNKQTSNTEMQKIHQKLSMLLAVAGLFVTIIAAAVVAQSMEIHAYSDLYVNETEIDNYLSFAYINEKFSS